MAWRKEILWPAAKQEFVGMDPQVFVEDRLAGYEFSVHADAWPAVAGQPKIFHRCTLRRKEWLEAVAGKS